jgi:hypothetical protein
LDIPLVPQVVEWLAAWETQLRCRQPSSRDLEELRMITHSRTAFIKTLGTTGRVGD